MTRLGRARPPAAADPPVGVRRRGHADPGDVAVAARRARSGSRSPTPRSRSRATAAPGPCDLHGLPAASDLELTHHRRRGPRPLAPPAGAHAGAPARRRARPLRHHLGHARRRGGLRVPRRRCVEHPVPDEAHPVRATRAALGAMQRWGATQVVVKGDLTHDGRAKDWACIGQLLADAEIPAHVLLGNHDHYGAAGEPIPETACLRPFGIDPIRGVASVEVPGLNLVLVDTTVPHHHGGSVARGQDAGHRPAAGQPPARLRRAPPPPRTTSGADVPAPGHPPRRGRTVPRRRALGPTPDDRDLGPHPPPPPAPGRLRGGHRGRLPQGLPGHVGGLRGPRGRHPPGRAPHRPIPPCSAGPTTAPGRRSAPGALWSPGLRSHRCFSHTWPG